MRQELKDKLWQWLEPGGKAAEPVKYAEVIEHLLDCLPTDRLREFVERMAA